MGGILLRKATTRVCNNRPFAKFAPGEMENTTTSIVYVA